MPRDYFSKMPSSARRWVGRPFPPPLNLLGGSAAILALMVGCASYERRPLNLASYEQTWRTQSIDVEPVKDYADRLTDPANNQDKSFDLSDGISLYEAQALALHFNPDLRMRRSQAQVPLVSATEAGWWDDPSIEVEILRFADRGSKTRWRFDGASIDGIGTGGLERTSAGYRRVEGDYIDDPWIVGANLSLTIPISGQLAVEKDWAWAQYNAAWKQIIIEEWQLIEQLQIAWLHWSIVTQKIDLLSDYLTRLDEVVTIATRLAEVGELSQTETRVLQIEVVGYQRDLQNYQAQAEQERLKIFALLGLAPNAPCQLTPKMHTTDLQGHPEDYREQLLAQHPRIQLARVEYESAEQKLRYEIRKQYPDLTIGPNYSFEEGFSRIGLGFGLPIPLWNHNRRGVAEAFAQRDTAQTEAEAIVEIVMNEFAQIEAHQVAAQKEKDILMQQVAPLVDRQVQETRRLLEIGEVNVLMLRDALAESLQTKLDVLETTLSEAIASYRLRNMLQPIWVSKSQENSQTESKEVNCE